MTEIINFRKELKTKLYRLGVPIHLSGFEYIIEVAEIYYFNTNSLKITKKVYPVVGMMFNKTDYCIERSIRHAIDICFTKANYTEVDKLFGNSICPMKGKPTNLHFISSICSNIL